jgi:hypothetical protein
MVLRILCIAAARQVIAVDAREITPVELGEGLRILVRLPG